MAIYAFGPFVLDVAEHKLMREGQRLALAGKTLDVLRLLLEAGGRLVGRKAFIAKLWPGVTVEERNLTVHISNLRRVLNAADGATDCIETVAKAGYRFILPVRLLEPTKPPTNDAALTGLQLVKAEARTNLRKTERLSAMRALGLFERGLTMDLNDAECHAGLASTFLLLASTVIRRPLPIEEATRLARKAAQRALVLDEKNAEARAVLGRLKMLYEWDWDGAEAEFACAVEHDPRSAEATLALGLLQSAKGRHDEALATLERARRLDPLRRDILEHLGMGYWMAGQAERALTVLADAVASEPTARRPHFRRMVVLDQVGRHDEAMAERSTWLELSEHAPFAARLAEVARRCGYRETMLEWIVLLEQYSQWLEVAIQRMAIGDPLQALDALERCVAQHADAAVFMVQYPSFRPLRGEPRFERLVRILGLAEV